MSEKYGVSTKTIYNWLKGKALGEVSMVEFNKIKRENQQLKEIIGAMTIELAKSKKKT